MSRVAKFLKCGDHSPHPISPFVVTKLVVYFFAFLLIYLLLLLLLLSFSCCSTMSSPPELAARKKLIIRDGVMTVSVRAFTRIDAPTVGSTLFDFLLRAVT